MQRPTYIVLATWLAVAGFAGNALAQSTVNSNETDQKDLAVTVYNSNIALVRDVRVMHLPEGSVDLRFMNIAASVNPATVHIVSLTAPKELTVLEQIMGNVGRFSGPRQETNPGAPTGGGI